MNTLRLFWSSVQYFSLLSKVRHPELISIFRLEKRSPRVAGL